MPGKLTINEALIWMKTLRTRHAELVTLRDANAHSERRFYGTAGDKTIEKTPVYSVRKLDGLVARVAQEIRLVDVAIKKANTSTTIEYEQNDAVLGNVEEEA